MPVQSFSYGTMNTLASPAAAFKSPGVRRIEAISSCFTTWHKAALFFGVFLIAYVYGLDGSTRFTFQGYATASFSQHSLLAAINVVRSIVAAAAQPAYAKIVRQTIGYSSLAPASDRLNPDRSAG